MNTEITASTMISDPMFLMRSKIPIATCINEHCQHNFGDVIGIIYNQLYNGKFSIFLL